MGKKDNQLKAYLEKRFSEFENKIENKIEHQHDVTRKEVKDNTLTIDSSHLLEISNHIKPELDKHFLNKIDNLNWVGTKFEKPVESLPPAVEGLIKEEKKSHSFVLKIRSMYANLKNSCQNPPKKAELLIKVYRRSRLVMLFVFLLTLVLKFFGYDVLYLNDLFSVLLS